MRVQINDLSYDPTLCYWMESQEDARESLHLEVFDLVREHGNTITLGKVIGCPEHLVDQEQGGIRNRLHGHDAEFIDDEYMMGPDPSPYDGTYSEE